MRAGTTLLSGKFNDYAETKDTVFVNARTLGDWAASGETHVRPEVAAFEQAGPRAFRISYRWHVGGSVPAGYQCFVHFSGAFTAQDADGEAIRFQNDHLLPKPTQAWKPGETLSDGPFAVRLPADLADGDYECGIGLYKPAGDQLAIEGESDSHGRIRVESSMSGRTAQGLHSRRKIAPETNGGVSQRRT